MVVKTAARMAPKKGQMRAQSMVVMMARRAFQRMAAKMEVNLQTAAAGIFGFCYCDEPIGSKADVVFFLLVLY